MRSLIFPACLVALSALPLFGSADPQLLSLVPANTKVLVGLNAQRTANSDLVQAVLRRHNADMQLQGLTEQTGFDPRRDLQYILIASAAGGSNSPNLVFAHGNFDFDRLAAAAKTKGATTSSIAGVNVIETTSHNDTEALAFPASGIAVVGPLNLVTTVIQSRSSVSSLDPQLSALIAAVDHNDAWFASIAPMSSFPAGMFGRHDSSAAGGQAQVMQSIIAESGGVRLGDTARLAFNAVTRSPQDASALADVMRFFASMLQTKAQNDPQHAVLASVLTQNLQINANGSGVQLTDSAPEQILEEALSSMGR